MCQKHLLIPFLLFSYFYGMTYQVPLGRPERIIEAPCVIHIPLHSSFNMLLFNPLHLKCHIKKKL